MIEQAFAGLSLLTAVAALCVSWAALKMAKRAVSFEQAYKMTPPVLTLPPGGWFGLKFHRTDQYVLIEVESSYLTPGVEDFWAVGIGYIKQFRGVDINAEVEILFDKRKSIPYMTDKHGAVRYFVPDEAALGVLEVFPSGLT